jgi:hypothetical protein
MSDCKDCKFEDLKLISPKKSLIIRKSKYDCTFKLDVNNIEVNPFTIQDTQSVNLEGNGLAGTPLTATVRLNPALDNLIQSTADGLLVNGTAFSYTDEQAQDAVGGIMNSSEFTYSDSTPSIVLNQVPWSKITGEPTTLAGYGITDPVVLTTGSYANPSWITSLDYSKLINVPPGSGSALNGLSVSGSDTVLGQDVGEAGNPANLLSNREVPLNAFGVFFTGTGRVTVGTSTPNPTHKLTVVATGTDRAIQATASTGTALTAFSSIDAIVGQSTGAGTGIQGSCVGAGVGVEGLGGSGIGGRFTTTLAGGTADPVTLELQRDPTGVGVTNGVGQTIMFRLPFTSGAVGNESGRIINYFSNAVSGAQSSSFEFHLMNNAVSGRKMLLANTGRLTLDTYGAGTFTGTTAFALGVDSSGNVIEFSPSAGSLTAATNGLNVISSTVQLGQNEGAVGNPAQLLSNREIPMNGSLISFKTTAPQDILTIPAIQSSFPQGDFRFGKNLISGNELVNFGFNLSNANTPIVAGQPAMGLSFEGSYQPGVGQLLQEFHLIYVKPSGTQVRPLSFTIDTNSDVLDGFLSVNSFELKDSDGTGDVWLQANGGLGSNACTFNLHTGPVGEYGLQYGFNTNAGNTTASISTNGPGAKEFHIGDPEGWGFVFLPTFFSSTTYNQFTTQVQPATDGNLLFGSPTNRWQNVDAMYHRAATGMRIGNFSGNELPNTTFDIVGPGSANGNIHITATTNGNAGVFIDNPSAGNAQIVARAQTGSGVIPVVALVDYDSPTNTAGFALERNTSPLLNGAQNDMIIRNTSTDKAMLFGTNIGGTVAERMRINTSGYLVVGATNNIAGTATNNNAAAGNIGEQIVSTISTYANYTTTATYQNITSITLTPGDWDISAIFTFNVNSATTSASDNAIFAVSTTTASAAGTTEGVDIYYIPEIALAGTVKFSGSMSPFRVSLSSTTTYYLNTQSTFSAGNPQFVGTIRARRMR